MTPFMDFAAAATGHAPGPSDRAEPPAPARRRRQRSDAALNHAAILDSARRLLAEDADASMASIAQAAGLGRGTVHRHFATREELLRAVRRQARDDAESDAEDRLRPPGELAHSTPTPLSVADVLNKVPPYQLGEQIVAEAQRLPGVSSAALYVVDLDGATMQRLAGPATFPARVAVPLAVGPEIPREGITALRDVFEELLPAAVVAPLHLRGRAIGVLLAVGTVDDGVHDLAHEAAVALALAPTATRTSSTPCAARARRAPAAEIQQNLLPPRIARIGGALIAGNVLPGYEIGGDWFDYAENHDGRVARDRRHGRHRPARREHRRGLARGVPGDAPRDDGSRAGHRRDARRPAGAGRPAGDGDRRRWAAGTRPP